MGGIGSGRRPTGRVTLVEYCESVDAFAEAARHGSRLPPRGRADGQLIATEATPAHFGGSLWWFRCGCGARARKLYRPPGHTRFACRRCHRLRYASQREPRRQREHRAADPPARS
jgi:hypothetical protein